MVIELKETKTLFEVWIDGHRRGSIRRKANGWYYKITSCNFGPVYPTVARVQKYIEDKRAGVV